MKIQFNRINHIQICIQQGEEEKGREFYCEILGLDEVEKPEGLKAKGGFWLQSNDIQIHIGTENLQGISKRHPAFEVNELDKIKTHLIKHNIRIQNDHSVPGFNRFSFFDYWDNRIELMQKI